MHRSEGARILNTYVKSFLNFFCLFFKDVGNEFFPRRAKIGCYIIFVDRLISINYHARDTY